MERIVEQSLLYDFYGELLTPHQKEIYEEAVFDDMSLGEIAQEQGISRQGVHDLLKRCNKILEEYESKLHLMERFLQMKQKAEEISKVAEQAQTDSCEKLDEALNTIRRLSTEILEELLTDGI